ncbi:ATP-binding protein [Streptomyces sp. AC550_RSS872]|uniref:ATP-binding protein n=1 Tax=Streptomyces sp. AC550_RSS872 TaxID=2823689 RepID=UPI0027E3F0FA|nr:ATP-binding protein [Streptomyces sp. AC550_RSS872]
MLERHTSRRPSDTWRSARAPTSASPRQPHPGRTRRGHADRTWDRRMPGIVRPDLLILDDFAMRQMTAPQADDLYELISERQGRSVIITSNRAPSDKP